MNHLTENQLNEYLDGLMEASALAACEAHLSDCADCQGRLAVLQSVFQALAALPEANPQRDLAASVLKNLSERGFGLGWRLALAIQAGLSLGLALLALPWLSVRIVWIMPRWFGGVRLPELKFPHPGQFLFSLPTFHMPSVPALALPIPITHTNMSLWLFLGIAAFLLFAVGNFSLIFHRASRARK